MKHAVSPAKPGLTCGNRVELERKRPPRAAKLRGSGRNLCRRSDSMSIPATSTPRNPIGGAA